ncbi:hypothetical protein [Deinococcus knuensis]|uniref:Uncharacterized protein n=1 Tax=Deinococcus knuensis TaxID=1837380 RepID=A0ABQ2SEU0_9DEIO|nr:hypothetical protein [Deinococcus knuensis]GGS26139.1 hypothetical protein GCM10008961_17090 [Deinococcus knuensis]
MKKFLLTATLFTVALPATLPAALAQNSQSQRVNGFSTIATLAKLKGLVLTQADLARLFANLKPGSAEATRLAGLFGISVDAFNQLVAAKGAPIPLALATRAVLEAATGKTLTTEAVAQVLKNNPNAVTSYADLLTLATNPTQASNLANQAAVIAGTPVTPRGGGN